MSSGRGRPPPAPASSWKSRAATSTPNRSAKSWSAPRTGSESLNCGSIYPGRETAYLPDPFFQFWETPLNLPSPTAWGRGKGRGLPQRREGLGVGAEALTNESLPMWAGFQNDRNFGRRIVASDFLDE